MLRRHPSLLLLLAALTLGLGVTPFLAGAAGGTKVFLPALACAGCTGSGVQPSPIPQPTNPPPTPVDADAFEARMIELVNQARVAASCPAATPNAVLMQATGDWSAYMDATGDYSHGTFEQFQQKYSAYHGGVLENINGGIESPEIAFDDWMLSPLHRRNIEFCYPPDEIGASELIYEIGVGYADGYWTLAIGWR